MQMLLDFVMLVLRCSLAFFSSRREQAIVELALRQQLAVYAAEASEAEGDSFVTMSPTTTPIAFTHG